MTYTVPKKVFTKDSIINGIVVFFTNGDFLTIKKNEICSATITFYDKLIKNKLRFSAVGHSGFIKLRIQSGKAKSEDRHLFNQKEYNLNRKEYIQNRLVNGGDIAFIKLFNQLNWSDCIFGDIYATLEGDYLYIRFRENEKYGAWESDTHYVDIAQISKKMIFKINLDFENCDEIDVYRDEIKEMNLTFDKELIWGSSDYVRSLKGGFIIVKFEDCYHKNRHYDVCRDKKTVKIKHLEERICGKKGTDIIDICHLYLDFYRYYNFEGEVIAISSFDEKEFEPYEKNVDDYGDYYKYWKENNYSDGDDYYEKPFISGYAKRLDDGSIMISFSKKHLQ